MPTEEEDRPDARREMAKIQLAAVSVQEPTLDEVFLALTGDGNQAEKGVTPP